MYIYWILYLRISNCTLGTNFHGFQVGLALVVEGEIVLGVMGCPNWKVSMNSADEYNDGMLGIIMVSHLGFGTWSRRLLKHNSEVMRIEYVWDRCLVDSHCLVHGARFCISDSQNWETIPLSALISSTLDESGIKDEKKILLIPACCGRYLLTLIN